MAEDDGCSSPIFTDLQKFLLTKDVLGGVKRFKKEVAGMDAVWEAFLKNYQKDFKKATLTGREAPGIAFMIKKGMEAARAKKDKKESSFTAEIPPWSDDQPLCIQAMSWLDIKQYEGKPPEALGDWIKLKKSIVNQLERPFNGFITENTELLRENDVCGVSQNTIVTDALAKMSLAAHSGYSNVFDYRSLFGDSAHHHHNDKVDYAHANPYVDYDAVYSHPSRWVSDNSGDHFDKYLVGGVFGAVAIVFILVVFCIGLAFGMVTCWAYMQQKALEKTKDKEVYLKVNDEENL